MKFKALTTVFALLLVSGTGLAAVPDPEIPEDPQPDMNNTPEDGPSKGLPFMDGNQSILPSQASETAQNVVSTITGFFTSQPSDEGNETRNGSGLGSMLGQLLSGSGNDVNETNQSQ